MRLRRITSLFTASVIATTAVFANFPANVAYAAEGSWTDNGDGSFSYTQTSGTIEPLEFDISGVEDWSSIKYVSAKVTADATVFPYIGGYEGAVEDGEYTSSAPVWMDNGAETTLIYYPTTDMGWVGVSFEDICENGSMEEGGTVTISDITFSESNPENAWYPNGDGTYTANMNGQNYINDLSINTDDVDWANTQYISMKFTGDATCQPVIAADRDGQYCTGAGVYMENGGETYLHFATEGQEFSNIRVCMWNVSDGMTMEISEITYCDTPLTDEWYPFEDKWVLNYDTAETIDGLGIDIYSVQDWSTVKYISADVSTEGKAHAALGANIIAADAEEGAEEVWTDGPDKDVEDGVTTVYLDTNGGTVTWCSLNLWDAYWTDEKDDEGNNIGYPLEQGQRVEVSNITISTEERTTITGDTDTWFEQDGVMYYINGDNTITVDDGFNYPIDTSSVEDWSNISEIRVTVESVTGAASFALTGTVGEEWTCDSAYVNGFTTTLSLATNGAEVFDPCINFWDIDDVKTALQPGTIIAIKDIQFVEFPVEESDWYMDDSGNWVFATDRDLYTTDEVPGLNIDISSVEDWSAIKYVSIDVETNGTISCALGGNLTTEDGWIEGEGTYFSDGEATVYFDTNGEELYDLTLMLFDVGDAAIVLYGGSEVTVSNITFSTEERMTITGETNTWFEQDGVMYYINGDEALTEFENITKDVSDKDWSNIFAVEMDVEAVRGDAQFNLGANVGINETWVYDYRYLDDARTTLRIYTGGEVTPELFIQFWPTDDEGTILHPNDIIAIKDIRFVEFPTTGEWIEGNGSWFYKNGDTAVVDFPGVDIDLNAYDISDWSEVKYIGADVYSADAINPSICTNLIIDDEWIWYSGVGAPTNGGTVVYPYFRTNGEEVGSAHVVFYGIGDDGSALRAGQCVSVRNITFSTEDVPALTDQWADDGMGNWYYENTTDSGNLWGYSFDMNSIPVENWEDIKYISVDVQVTEGNVKPRFSTSFDGVYTSSGSKVFSGADADTLYFETNGRVPEWLNIDFDWANEGDLAILPNTTVTLSNFVFSTEELDHSNLKDQWYQEQDGWHYVKGDSNGDVNEFSLDASSVKDWSKIKYISADITVSDGSIAPCFTATVNGMFASSGNKYFSGTQTIYLETNGAYTEFVCIGFGEANDDGSAALANAEITISNIVFSEEALDHSDLKDQWYLEDDGWHFVKGEESGSIEGLNIDISSVEDWSEIKYISAKVSVSDGYLAPKFTTNFNSEFASGNDKTISGEDIIYLVTNGQAPEGLCIDFYGLWQNDEGCALVAGAEITVSDIVFSKEEINYSDVKEEWYFGEDEAWHYNKNSEGGDILELPIDIESVDWSQIKYISADISVSDGNVNPVFNTRLNDEDIQSIFTTITSEKADTIYLATNGYAPEWLNIAFCFANDGDIAVVADASITVSNINFSTEELDYSTIKDKWINDNNGNWWYTNSEDISGTDPLSLDTSGIENWEDFTYITADVTVTNGSAMPVLCGNVNGEDLSGTDRIINDGETATIIIPTFGKAVEYLDVQLWWIEEELALSAGTTVKISNFLLHTDTPDIREYWYEDADGNWIFVDSGDGYTETERSVTFASDISADTKYVKVEVTVDGTAEVHVRPFKDNGEFKEAYSWIIENDTATIYVFTYDNNWQYVDLDIWGIGEGSSITVNNIVVSEDDITDYEDITGQWIQTGESSFYYNHGNNESGYVEGPFLMAADIDFSDVLQSISITARYENAEPDSIKLAISGTDQNGEWYPGFNFPLATTEQTITRYYRGTLKTNPMLDAAYITPGTKIYISDISFNYDTIADPGVAEGETLIDDNQTILPEWSVQHDIQYPMLEKLDSTGILKIYAEKLDGYETHEIRVAMNSWDANGLGFTWLTEEPVELTGSVYEVPVTEEMLTLIEDCYRCCEMSIQGYGIVITRIVFTEPVSVIPENVKAAAGSGEVKLTWNAVNGATKYAVYLYDNGVYTCKSSAVTGTSYTVTGLTGGTKYGFKVKSYVNGAWSEASTIVYATPTAAVSVIPENIKTTAGDGKVTMTWNAVSGATKYAVYMLQSGAYVCKSNAVTGTSYTFTGLTNGTKYNFKVKAFVNGAWKTASAAVSGTPVASASTSVIPENIKTTAGDSKVTMTWNAVTGATKYAVYMLQSGSYVCKNNAVTGTSYTFTGLTNGTKYSFRVKAFVNGAWKAASAAVSGTPVASTSIIPENIKTTAGDSKVTMTWSAVTGATKYAVYMLQNGSYVCKSNAVTGTSYTFTGLTNGTKYSFRVKAFVNGAWKAASAAVSGTPAASASTSVIPENIKTTGGNGTVTMSWSAVTGATKYAVYMLENGAYVCKSSAVTGTSYTFTGLTNGTKYSFRVKAYVSGAWKTASATVYGTPVASTSVIPENIKTTVGNGTVTMSWDAVTGATKYAVYMLENGTYVCKSNAVTGTSYTFTGLTSGTKYSFRVKAFVNGAWKAASSTVTANT